MNKKFGRFSFYRNRLIADLLSKTIFMERVGTGIERIKSFCKNNGNKVKFDFDDFCFFTIISKKDGAETTQKSSEKILEIIKNKPEISAQEIANIIAISPRAVEKNIAKLKQKGKLKRIGHDRGGYWEIKK